MKFPLFRLSAAAATLLAAVPATAGSKPSRPGSVIVKYREGTAETHREELRRRHGGRKIREFRELKMEAMRVPEGKDAAEAAAEISADPSVEYAEPDFIVKAMATPGDPQFYSQWGLNRIAAPAAWDASTGNPQVVVAIIDSGVDYTHPDLQGNMWVNPAEAAGRAGVDDDGNGIADDLHGFNALANSGDPLDDNEHGTHVAGIIGATGNNAVGVSGVNWRVSVMACKFMDAEGAGAVSDAIECLQYVRRMKDAGVNIVATNNSWGSGSYSRALRDAIASQRDILFFAAAGNDGADNDVTASYPANYDLPNVVSVTATSSSDTLPVDSSTRAVWANTGRRTVHVAAPGASIYSTLPGGRYGNRSGTSMATPFVTGAAALLSAAEPSLDWREIRNRLLSTGDPLPPLSAKTITGRRLNLSNAVSCLDSRAFSALRFPAAPQKGGSYLLSALSINCGTPAGPVTVSLWGGESIMLHDDGASPDAVAGDGIFSATYIAPRAGEIFLFSSPAGNETVGMVKALATLTVGQDPLKPGFVGKAYTTQLAAGGGAPPYSWRPVSGSLPPGISLGSGGVLSGTPSVAGTFSFTVEARDASAATGSSTLTLTVDGPRPDLMVSSLAAPAAVTVGGEAALTVTLKNRGKAAAQGSTVAIYLSGDRLLDSGDLLVAEVAVPPLLPGEKVSVPLTLTIPGTPPGRYYWEAVADAASTTGESSETNNVRRGRAVTILP
ncbi:MAG TPA: S8 family serine peptidase [Verrucomicrobiae bacterium]|nr:S8 family serine peptidase [Verrucomicrobiae bacterium]